MHSEFNSSGLQREVHSPGEVQGAPTKFYITSAMQTLCLPFKIAFRVNRVFWSSNSAASVSGGGVWQTNSMNAVWLGFGRIWASLVAQW